MARLDMLPIFVLLPQYHLQIFESRWEKVINHFSYVFSLFQEFFNFFRIFEAIVKYCHVYTNQIPLSFVLGFYVSIVMKRWWDQYTSIPWPDPIAVFVSCNIHGQVSLPCRVFWCVAKIIDKTWQKTLRTDVSESNYDWWLDYIVSFLRKYIS